jgi:Lectin C-type domain
MGSRAWLPFAGALLLVGVSGCPVTDDYYLETSQVMGIAGDSTTGETTLALGGSAAAGGGSAGTGGVAAALAGTGSAGTADAPQAGASHVGNGGAPACVPSTERCNGHDDDCDDLIDELACNSMVNSTVACSGFVLPGEAAHGYMLCIGTKDYSHAQQACAAQNMRLAWLETVAENSAVSKMVTALSNDAEVSFGATDVANEGQWFWDGGVQFWDGNQTGKAVDGLFNAWTDRSPNDVNSDEDCAVLMSAAATWGDRSCSGKYAYLCEEIAP